MMASELHWRDLAKLAEASLRPSRFDCEMSALLEQGHPGDQAVNMLCGLIGHYLIEAAGLAATLSLPGNEALDELRELAKYLGQLEIPQPGARRQGLYPLFLSRMRTTIQMLAMAMPAVLSAYLTEKQGARGDPNALLQYADEISQSNPQKAQALIARAGAWMLRGRQIWWGWPGQVHPSLRPWTVATTAFCNSITQDGKQPLNVVARERERWRKESHYLDQIIQGVTRGQACLAEIQNHGAHARDAGMDELIYALFQGEDALTDALLMRYTRCRSQAIPHLVNLVQNQRLWPSDAAGHGWAPIHAADLLRCLRATEAAEALVRTAATTDRDDYLHERAILALEQLGRAPLRPLLDVMAYSRHVEQKLALAPVLGRIGRANPLAVQALSDLYLELSADMDKGPVIMGLVAVEDAHTLPLLQQALDDPGLSWIDRMEIEAALEELAETAVPAAALA